jgi:hypothetical protein
LIQPSHFDTTLFLQTMTRPCIYPQSFDHFFLSHFVFRIVPSCRPASLCVSSPYSSLPVFAVCRRFSIIDPFLYVYTQDSVQLLIDLA